MTTRAMSAVRSPWPLVGSTLLLFACGGAREQPPDTAPASAPRPNAVPDAGVQPLGDAGVEAAAPPVSPGPPAPQLSDERAALAEKLGRARWVVRGRVREGKEVVEQRATGAVRYQYAIVDVLEWVVGDAKNVHKAYAKSFPVWNIPIPVSVNKSPAAGHRDPALELSARVGEERLFLVTFPSEAHLTSAEPGPPPFVVKRWGKYTVAVQDHLPLSERDEVMATLRDLEQRARWLEQNAERLEVRDRFRRAAPEAVAKAAAGFVVAQLRERAKLKVDLGPPEQLDGPTKVFTFPLTGDADASGKLTVSITPATGRVRSLQVDVPFVKKAAAEQGTTRAEALANTKSALGIESSGGEMFEQATASVRGDGVSFWRIVLHAGHLYGVKLGDPGRIAIILVTPRSGVVFEYKNAFAEPVRRAPAGTPGSP